MLGIANRAKVFPVRSAPRLAAVVVSLVGAWKGLSAGLVDAMGKTRDNLGNARIQERTLARLFEPASTDY